MKETMRQLAESYFEGTIQKAQEAELLTFIMSNEDHKALFDEWERAWAAEHEVDLDTQTAWTALSRKLNATDADMVAPVVPLHRWRAFAAAVAAVLLLAGSTWLGMRLSQPAESFYTCAAPVGSQSQLTLPDGSKVWLNAGSALRYSTLFNNKHRVVELHGEGYFEVTKHEGAEFTVKTNDYDVVVKGTKFNVSAYDDDQLVTTSLMEGRVEVGHQDSRLVMRPGETVTYNRQSGRLEKHRSTRETRAWVSGGVDYDGIMLDDLARVLSRRYGVSVHVVSPQLGKVKFSISLRNKEDINEVLAALNRITPIRVTRKGKDIYLE